MSSTKDAEAAALAAAGEILEATDVPLDDDELPEAPERAAGEVERAEPLCKALRTKGARLLPGVKPSEGASAGGEMRRCSWREAVSPNRSLNVHVEAMAPSAFSGLDGTKGARHWFGQVSERSGGRELTGLGDEALMEPRARGLYVRKDNLMVDVAYDRLDIPESRRLAHMKSVAPTVPAGY